MTKAREPAHSSLNIIWASSNDTRRPSLGWPRSLFPLTRVKLAGLRCIWSGPAKQRSPCLLANACGGAGLNYDQYVRRSIGALSSARQLLLSLSLHASGPKATFFWYEGSIAAI